MAARWIRHLPVVDQGRVLGVVSIRDVAGVFAAFGRNVGRLRALVFAIIATLPEQRDCPCPNALDGITLPFELP